MGTLRCVLAGCGAMSGEWLRAAATVDGLEIVALVDLDRAAAERQAWAHRLAGALIGTDLADILPRVRADMVFDVVVPAARRDVARIAFANRCHLLSEKPMAESLDDARWLVQAAEQAGVLHAVVQNRRYLAGVRRLTRFLRDGAIGDITALHCDFFLAPRFGGFREAMAHPLLLDMAIHTFDVGRLLAGGSAAAVYCHEWNPAGSWYAAGASAVAVFEMQGGAVFTYRGSWCADGLRTSWEAQWRIIGTRGSVTWDGGDVIRCELHDPAAPRDGVLQGVRDVAVPPLDARDAIGGHAGVIRAFCAAVQGGTAPETVGRENIKSLAMVFGAIESARCKARVPLD